MQNLKLIAFLLGISFLFFSCKGDQGPKNVEAWVPVYQSDVDGYQISLAPVRPIQNVGKIFVLGNTLFQVEKQKGIHLIDISDPVSPVQTSFIEIPGVQEVAVKGNQLYANNFNDLVVVELLGAEQIAIKSRLKNAFHMDGLDWPELSGYFECIDPSKGKVVSWERKMVAAPKCRF